MKYLILLLAPLLPGCFLDPQEHWYIDRVMQNRIFMECLRVIPPGPQQTHYNDWDDVVIACNEAARNQSQKKIGEEPTK